MKKIVNLLGLPHVTQVWNKPIGIKEADSERDNTLSFVGNHSLRDK